MALKQGGDAMEPGYVLTKEDVRIITLVRCLSLADREWFLAIFETALAARSWPVSGRGMLS